MLPEECLVTPRSPEEIATRIKELLGDKDKLKILAKNNYQESTNYHDDVLTEKRNAYYQYVIKDINEKGNISK